MGRIDNDDIVSAMRLAVLALDDVFDMGLSAVLDTLGTANDLAAGGEHESARLGVRVIGVRPRVRTHQGMLVPVEEPGRRPDVVLVPALGAKTPDAVASALTRRDVA